VADLTDDPKFVLKVVLTLSFDCFFLCEAFLRGEGLDLLE
jgi:hypothetical protein